MEFLFWFSIGGALGVALWWRDHSRMIAANKELIELIVAEHVHEITVDTIGDMMYWYRKVSGTFVVQGTSLEEISRKLKEMYTDQIFLVGDYVMVGPDFEPVSRDNE